MDRATHPNQHQADGGRPERSAASTAAPAATALERPGWGIPCGKESTLTTLGETAVSCRVGVPSNTPPSTRHSGVDWLDVSLWCKWGLHRFQRLEKLLDEKTAESREGEGREILPKLVTPDGQVCWVRPYARSFKSHRYTWALDLGYGITLQLQRVQDGSEQPGPNAFIHVGAMGLLKLGHQDAYFHASQFLRMLIGCDGLGGSITDAQVTRLDLCGDLLETKIDSFHTAHHSGKRVGRATQAKTTEYYYGLDKLTGYRLGQDACVLRLYDKLKELETQPAKLAAMIECRWGYAPSACARVEFQLRRQALYDWFGACSVGDVFVKIPTIANYLGTQWYRQTAKVPNRQHRKNARIPNSKNWEEVLRTFAQFGEPGERERGPKRPAKLSALKAQLRGLAAKIAVLQGCTDQDELPENLAAQFRELLADGVTYDAFEAKNDAHIREGFRSQEDGVPF